jgi:hypothetical protein
MVDVKILFIGGSGRSGSTLIENVLGQLDGFVCVGELNTIWKAGLAENRLCGCGRPFLACEFWRSVIDASFGSLDPVDIQEIILIQHQVCRMRMIPKMTWSFLQTSGYQTKIVALRNWTRMLLKGIKEVSGAKTIVDSSKWPAQVYLLRMLDDVELHVLQLVRDSRAVAYSWQRKKALPSVGSENMFMIRVSPFKSALDWKLRHFLLSTLNWVPTKNMASYSTLRYEDFVSAPEAVLSQVVKGIEPGSNVTSIFKSPFVVSRTRVIHSLEGNPSKFITGDIQLRADYEWKTAMRSIDYAVVSVITAPYLKKFGYI